MPEVREGSRVNHPEHGQGLTVTTLSGDWAEVWDGSAYYDVSIRDLTLAPEDFYGQLGED